MSSNPSAVSDARTSMQPRRPADIGKIEKAKNPNGIVIGGAARIDTNSFIASTRQTT